MIKDYNIVIPETGEQIVCLPVGKKIFSLIMLPPPSWNEILYLKPLDRADFIRAERQRGIEIGLDVGKALGIKETVVKEKNSKSLRGSFKPYLSKPISNLPLFCLLFIWREPSQKDPDKPRYQRDIYNASIKGLIDGFTDAGLWKDDNENYHTDFWVSYRGVSSKPRMELTFYEILVTRR